jgi:four helix bundle protein
MAGWKNFKEIDAWQLSMKLQQEFIPFLERPPANRNRKFCEDAIDAVSSPARNIAEGFEKYGHGEFAKYALIAKGSLGETQTNLITAKDRGFVSPADFERLWRLSVAAKSATTGLWRYLKRTDAPNDPKSRKRQPGRRQHQDRK